MPGINLVDEMMLNRGDIQATQQKVIKLQAWSVEAREKVKQIAEDVSIRILREGRWRS